MTSPIRRASTTHAARAERRPSARPDSGRAAARQSREAADLRDGAPGHQEQGSIVGSHRDVEDVFKPDDLLHACNKEPRLVLTV